MNKGYQSIVKSRLKLTQSAFVDMLDAACSRLAGYETQIKNFHIVVHSIRSIKTSFSPDQVAQNLILELSAKKSRGWMPVDVRTEVLVDWAWTIGSKRGYPALEIQILKLASQEKSEVEFMNFKIGIPDAILNKIFHDIENQSGQIEQVTNDQIRSIINSNLEKAHELAFLDLPTPKKPALKIKKWLWNTEISESAIFSNLQVGLFTYWSETDLPEFEFGISLMTKEMGDWRSNVKIPMLLSLIEKMAQDKTIPLGKLGETRIVQLKIEPQNRRQVRLKIVLDGQLSGAILADIKITNSTFPKFEISISEMNLDNKLLDFGASIFESKIEKVLETEIDKLIQYQTDRLIEMINQKLSLWQDYISIPAGKLDKEEINITLEVDESNLSISLDSDYLKEVEVKRIPSSYLTN